jgi:hypothetical protein
MAKKDHGSDSESVCHWGKSYCQFWTIKQPGPCLRFTQLSGRAFLTPFALPSHSEKHY